MLNLNTFLLKNISNIENRYSNIILDLCFTLFYVSPNVYNILRCYLNLPCENTLRYHFQGKVKEIVENLQGMSNIADIIKNYYEQNSFYEVFDMVLGVDAFSFDRLPDDIGCCKIARNFNEK